MPRLWIFGQFGDASSAKDSKKQDKDVPADAQSVKGSPTSVDSTQTTPSSEKNNLPAPTTLYYAVSLPGSKTEGKTESPLVYLDIKAALEAVSKHEGARFKRYHSYEEAINFASQPVESVCKTPRTEMISSPPMFDTEKSSGVNEKTSQFRGPKSQEIVKLRNLIIAGDVTSFHETVWCNPRYLITSVDTPTIFQEGSRYNALHIAAKYKQAELCEEIINTIQNPEFLRLLYSDDTEEIRLQRTSHILDLYLNMPDKGLCETPLHFAAKFGCLKTVMVLSSHPSCDVRIRNKYGLMAKNVICSRCPTASIQLKQRIKDALEEKYFVPVLRSEDNSIQPVVGKPFCKGNSKLSVQANSGSPHSNTLSIRAIAGPMSPEEADSFYKTLKSPPANFSRTYYNELHKIRLCDNEKGLERIGRNLAQRFKTTWREFWPSLNAWCDLTSPEGLLILEEHLNRLHQETRLKEMTGSAASYDSDQTNLNGSYNFMHSTPCKSSTNVNSNCSNSSSSSSGISAMCSRLEQFHVYTSPSHTSLSSHRATSTCESNAHHHLKLRQYLNFSDQDNTSESLDNRPKFEIMLTSNKNGVQSLMNTDGMNANTHQKVPDAAGDNVAKMNGFGPHGTESSFPDLDSSFTLPNHGFVFSLHDVCKDSIKELLQKDDAHQFLFSMNNVILCMLKVFSVLALNSDYINGKKVHEFVEDVLPEIKCLLKSSQDIGQDFSEVHSFIAEQIYKEMPVRFLKQEENVIFRLVTSYLQSYFSLKFLEKDEEELAFIDNALWQHLKCILQCFCALSGDTASKFEPCSCSWTYKDAFPKRFEMFSNCDISFMRKKENQSSSMADTDSEEFFTPPASPLHSESDDEPVTPEEGLEIYIEGEYPSKADLDILHAIENVSLDPVKYPHISQWKHLILSKDKKTIESWRTPRVFQRMRSQFSDLATTPPISPLASDCSSQRPRKLFDILDGKTDMNHSCSFN